MILRLPHPASPSIPSNKPPFCPQLCTVSLEGYSQQPLHGPFLPGGGKAGSFPAPVGAGGVFPKGQPWNWAPGKEFGPNLNVLLQSDVLIFKNLKNPLLVLAHKLNFALRVAF